MIKQVIILLCMALPMMAGADTLDYQKMSRQPARELFRQANIYSQLHKEDTAAAYYLYTIGACSRDGGSEAALTSAKAYRELGKCYFNQGYYSKAFDAFSNAIKICDANGYTDQLPHLYNNLGSIYCTWGDQQTGLHYFHRGLASLGNHTNEEIYITLLINIIGAELCLGNTDNAWTSYKTLLNQANRNATTQYYCLLNRALILINEGKTESAKTQLLKAAKYAETHNLSQLFVGYCYSNIGNLLQTEHPDSALKFYNKALHSEITPFMRRSLLKNMASLYKNHNPGLANKYNREYLLLTDSLFDNTETNRTRGAQFLYETEKNYREMERLNNEKRDQESKIKSQRLTIIIATAIIAVILLLITLLIHRSIKLRAAYRNLFTRSKTIIATEQRIQKQLRILEKENHTLRTEMAQSCGQKETASPLQQTDGARIQSTDKLTESRIHEILIAILDVVDRKKEIFDSEFSIEMLADLTGINSKYISRAIKDSTGNNFRAWINDIRIREAQVRLLDTGRYGGYTISAIAQSVGYRSHANFILLFKKQQDCRRRHIRKWHVPTIRLQTMMARLMSETFLLKNFGNPNFLSNFEQNNNYQHLNH